MNDNLISELWKSIDDDEHEIMKMSAELEEARQIFYDKAIAVERDIFQLRRRSFDSYSQILKLAQEEL